ncbi:hypothetical protein SHI21_18500 [Bacteriovorax sp. PP10]|uniref:Uncharacterized protein n=1 Tax=Bacteriovorax antarcticus TaxID=3088717 RepID=A0ABU5W075_9BACT|nr:hypothetical protein [Bacteriovorax sp. PP10]MEA9358232.1 hypothetical protein [Bacteriovorax sp. PP10]
MKSLIVLLAMAFSANSFANEAVSQSTIGMGAATAILTSTTSGIKPFGKAEAIIREANEYRLTGIAPLYLADQVKNLQSEMDVSEAEAVDLLVEAAKEILSLNY